MMKAKCGYSTVRALLVGLLLLSQQGVHAAMQVVTTTSDLKSLVEAVGGPHVTVTSLVPAGSEAEEYAPRPQDIDRLRAADMVVRIGLDYDLWLDRLLRQTGRRALARGGEAYVDASNAIVLLEVKGGGVGGGGHAHGVGNPHYWLDPNNAAVITGNVVEALARLDPGNAKFYERQRNEFLARLDERIKQWASRLAPLAGKPLITYHNNWPYLARRFRLNFIGTLEPRPGVAPSAAELARLIKRMQAEKVAVIVRHPQEPSRDVDFLARKTGARVAVLAASVGDLPQAQDYFSLFDTNVAALLAAFGEPTP
ncbi:MAG: metal ABC transporter substrate-binding protein [Rhodocyclaceae bacterium]|nr:metal ABC transporter substrate-binding protein [Rhodocyclaceae bacterium]